MPQRILVSKKRSLGFCLVVGLAAAMALLTWFSAQAEDRPASQSFDRVAQEATGITPATLQSTEATSMTAFLPTVFHNYPRFPSVFGVQMFNIAPSGGLTEAVNARMVWVRFDAFRWDRLEPERTDPPTYNWQAVNERSLINAEKNGMEVVAIVHGAPDWALKSPGQACGAIDEDALGAFGEFMNAMVTEYSQPPYNVRYWEIGNEPDIDPALLVNADPDSEYGCWGDGNQEHYGGEYFAEMLKVIYPAIKAADPRARVVLGGLLLGCDPRHPDGCKDSIYGTRPPKFLEGILLNGGGDYFDIVGYHTYSYFDGLGKMGSPTWPGSDTLVPEKAEFIRGVLAQYGYADKPLMNTEAALLCYDGWLPQGCREQQAVFVPRAFADAMAQGLEALTYYAMINDHWLNTGLVTKEDLTPRPPYYTYVVASEYLSSARYVGPARGYPQGIEGYEFARSAGRLDLIWSADGSARSVVLPLGASAHDRYGKLVGSATTIQVDYGPVWVTR